MCDDGQLGFIVHTFHQHDEFIRTKARQYVGFVQRRLQAGRDLSQQQISLGIAQRIVDIFKMIDIQMQQADVARRARAACQGSMAKLKKQGPVGQMGQFVVLRQMVHDAQTAHRTTGQLNGK